VIEPVEHGHNDATFPETGRTDGSAATIKPYATLGPAGGEQHLSFDPDPGMRHGALSCRCGHVSLRFSP
jgi:hypothetical protein